MFTSGWAKATSGWLDPKYPSAYGHVLHNYLSIGRQTWLGERLIRFQTLWFWKMADWSVVSLELLFLPAALHRRTFCLVAGIATLFHLGVLLVMDISFPANILAYGAFVRYSELPLFRSLKFNEPPSRRKAKVIFLVAATLGSVAACGGKSVSNAFHVPLDKIVLWAGAAIALTFMLQKYRGRGR